MDNKRKKLPIQDIPDKQSSRQTGDHIPSSAEDIESSGGVVETDAGAAGIRETT